MSKIADAYDEYRDAQNELALAQQHFDQADPEYVDIATHRLHAAELRFDAVYRSVKGGEQIA